MKTLATPSSLVVYGAGRDHGLPLGDLDRATVFVEVQRVAEAAARPRLPAVLLLGPELAAGTEAGEQLAALPESVVVLAIGKDAEDLAKEADRLFLALDAEPDPQHFARAVLAAAQHARSLRFGASARTHLEGAGSKVDQLNRLGVALMHERDEDRLLRLILHQARRLTSADAAILVLVEKDDEGRLRLSPRVAESDARPELAGAFEAPRASLGPDSIVGDAVRNREPIAIDDVYRVTNPVAVRFLCEMDQRIGYRSKSVLLAPMTDSRDDVVGVLLLLNRMHGPRRPDGVENVGFHNALPFTERDEQVLLSLAGQASISIENRRLCQEIEGLFEGFVRAAVTAIEQRDPGTKGHSIRVAALACDLAQRIDASQAGPFRHVRFAPDELRELRYAALLHDFGKVGVREDVLRKARKLPPIAAERIGARFDFLRRTAETEFLRRQVDFLRRHGREGFDAFAEGLRAAHREELEHLDTLQKLLRRCDEPSDGSPAGLESLREATRRTYRGADDRSHPVLRPEEFACLSIPSGTLDPREREEIQEHVRHTGTFLRQIPWTRGLSRVAEIASMHHRKLDGSGYPSDVRPEEIPIQSRILTIADIFDALTASDRPYRRAMSTESALEVLQVEVDAYKLDGAVFALLLESKAYERILETDWTTL